MYVVIYELLPVLSYLMFILCEKRFSSYLCVTGTLHVQNTLSFMEGRNQVHLPRLKLIHSGTTYN